ncbi:MAG: hypothetical protein JW867_05485 [Candidatus Omnitrophica bacterium]|nr:hypothetical protein [Candidatus Omnitrophota bacterium]
MKKQSTTGRIKNKRAQTFIEYALVIAITVGVLLFMHNYLNRSLQGRLKDSIDRANRSGDYTTSAGHGHLSKIADSVIWENNRGHQVTWRQTWHNENFSIDSAAELPFRPRTPCQGDECILGNNLANELAASALGEAALAASEGRQGPFGAQGMAVGMSEEDAQYYQDLVDRRMENITQDLENQAQNFEPDLIAY